MDTSSRNLNLDILKLVMAIFVVGIHDNLLSEYPALNIILVDYVFRLAVPVFFVLNGFFLARLAADWKASVRWLRKVAFLYLFWAIVYLPFILGKTVPFDVGLTATKMIFGYFHLWYLPALLVAGLLVVFALRNLSLRYSCLLAALSYLVGLSAQFAVTFRFIGEIRPEFYRNAVLFAFPLVFLGAALAPVAVTSKITTRRAGLLFIFGGLIMAAEIYLSFRFGGNGNVDIIASAPLLATALIIGTLQIPLGPTTPFFSKASTFMFFAHFGVLLMMIHHSALSKIHSSVVHFAAAITICLCLVPAATWLNRHFTKAVGIGFI